MKKALPFVVVCGLILFVLLGPKFGGKAPLLPEYRSAMGDAGPKQFEIVLRPISPLPTSVVAYAFVLNRGEAIPFEAKVEVTGDGSIRLSGSARLIEGVHELRVVIAPPDTFTRFDDALRLAAAGKSEGDVRVVSVPVR